MLGPVGSPHLHAKGKETHGLLKFAVGLLEKHKAKLMAESPIMAQRTEFLLAAGFAAIKFDELLDSAPRQPNLETLEAMLACILRHNKLFHLAGGGLMPKHHAMIHMIQRSQYLGNPKTYHTYHDEAINGLIKRIAASARRNTFCFTVIYKYHILQLLRKR